MRIKDKLHYGPEENTKEVKEETTVEKKKFHVNWKTVGTVAGTVAATAGAILGGLAIVGKGSRKDYYDVDPRDYREDPVEKEEMTE